SEWWRCAWRVAQSDLPCEGRSRDPGTPAALPQLVAIDYCAGITRHIVEDAALNKRVYARVAEQHQRRTIIIATRIARDLPSWTPPASLPSGGLNACGTLEPLVALFKGGGFACPAELKNRPRAVSS